MKRRFNPSDSCQEWFCINSYTKPNRPKMEASLYDYCKKLIMHHVVFESNFKMLVKELDICQEYKKRQHPRWKNKIKYHFELEEDNIVSLYIGESRFELLTYSRRLKPWDSWVLTHLARYAGLTGTPQIVDAPTMDIAGGVEVAV